MPRPPPGDLSDPAIELTSLTSPALAGGFFTTRATWKEAEWRLCQVIGQVIFPGVSLGRRVDV